MAEQGDAPKLEASKKKELPVDTQKARALGGLLEHQLTPHLDRARQAIAAMRDDEKFKDDVSKMQDGLNMIDRTVYGLRNADTITLKETDLGNPDFSFTFKEQIKESPPLPQGEIIITGADYQQLMKVLTHQINSGLTKFQFAGLIGIMGGFPQETTLIEDNRKVMTDLMKQITTDNEGIKIKIDGDKDISHDNIDPRVGEF